MKANSAKKARKAKKKARQSKAKARVERIFSGEESRPLWGTINEANTVTKLGRALFMVCCRLQELEARIAPPTRGGGLKWQGEANH